MILHIDVASLLGWHIGIELGVVPVQGDLVRGGRSGAQTVRGGSVELLDDIAHIDDYRQTGDSAVAVGGFDKDVVDLLDLVVENGAALDLDLAAGGIERERAAIVVAFNVVGRGGVAVGVGGRVKGADHGLGRRILGNREHFAGLDEIGRRSAANASDH